MRATNAAIVACLIAAAAPAQVLAPEEIRDPQLRALQQKYFSDLKLITRAVAAHEFPYHFYFSRQLDLDEKAQKASDQRSVQFDRYQGQVVLKITGNYFVSYSAELMKPEERARLTYQAVILPLLRAAVPAMDKADAPQAFAFEISHHVRKRVLGVSNEAVENMVLILPKASAQRLVASSDPQAQQAAVLEGQMFLNAAPISLWPRPDEEAAPEAATRTPAPAGAAPAPAAAKASVETPAPPAAARETSPEAVKGLQKGYQTSLDRMVQEMESQAHFIRYAPPAFIPFHNGLYLQLSLTTTLPQAAAGSQYRLAALAFDQHIAHLIRPAVAYFKDRDDFDGIDFSATVRLAADSADAGALAVEFFFPLKLLRTYADFDSTGQQLIDAGFVLINGERVSLNLQVAEAGIPSK